MMTCAPYFRDHLIAASLKLCGHRPPYASRSANFRDHLIAASLKLLLHPGSVDSRHAYFRDHLIAASLKLFAPGALCDAGGRFPRSSDRGLIEAVGDGAGVRGALSISAII